MPRWLRVIDPTKRGAEEKLKIGKGEWTRKPQLLPGRYKNGKWGRKPACSGLKRSTANVASTVQ